MANSIRTLEQLGAVLGPFLPDSLAAAIERDQRSRATMSIRVPPHMLNTMSLGDLWSDPIRRYTLPAWDDRELEWPNHPMAARDSLHEADMWAVEGLTHRYPTKVLAELTRFCPQYCGHCTRMDLVGPSTDSLEKREFASPQSDRRDDMLAYIAASPQVRDVVISGGDVAQVPTNVLKNFLLRLLDIEHIRDIRLASKALIGMPQVFLESGMLSMLETVAGKAWQRGVRVALHTHANHAAQITGSVCEATRKVRATGLEAVRNQAVLLRGTNTSSEAILDLCFNLVDAAGIEPYYFYMCDMVPNAEHWRVGVGVARRLQAEVMGYLPGFATPRIVCDVPFLGKRWVDQVEMYDTALGISYWRNEGALPAGQEDAGDELCRYYDPIRELPREGQEYWSRVAAEDADRVHATQ